MKCFAISVALLIATYVLRLIREEIRLPSFPFWFVNSAGRRGLKTSGTDISWFSRGCFQRALFQKKKILQSDWINICSICHIQILAHTLPMHSMLPYKDCDCILYLQTAPLIPSIGSLNFFCLVDDTKYQGKPYCLYCHWSTDYHVSPMRFLM